MALLLVRLTNNFIEIKDSHVDVQNCMFSNNIAKNGGAVSIECNYLTK
jgi:predicted outer membrane repeat protein